MFMFPVGQSSHELITRNCKDLENKIMEQDEERQQRTHVVVDTPNQHREVITQRTETIPEKSGISPGTVAIVAIVAIALIGIAVYMVSNKNKEAAADRNANLSAATMNSSQQAPPATTIIQQPAAQQPPLIIQQAPAAQPQSPVIVQQAPPSQATVDSQDDANTQATATKKLNESQGMALITVTMRRGTATLSGTASSEALKSKAEQVVRAVRGVSAVDNQITISSL
jgi:hypothetical protein